jgi:cytochrome c oxidase subunit 2
MRQFLNRWMPPDYSAHGWQIDQIVILVHWLMFILLVFWGTLFLYSLIRFRASRNPRASYQGITSHWSRWGEAGLAAVEVILLAGFSIPAWYRWAGRAEQTGGSRPFEVRIVAEQFAWNVHYPGPDGKFGRTDVRLVSATNPVGLDLSDPAAKDDVVAINQLHLPVNRQVLIHISSKDVIHSFKLPVMRVEQDAIPGMDVPIHFTPVRTTNGDRWEIACAQLCGLGHYRMRGLLSVDSQKDLDQWLKDQAAP